MRYQRVHKLNASQLVGLMGMTRIRQVTEPRDKVYGLLGLLSPELAQHLVPDYKKDVTSVYLSTAKTLLE